MLKVIGCVLIFISCTSLGFLKASSYRARIAELESVAELLKLLDMEITYRRDSLVRAFGKVSDAKPCRCIEGLQRHDGGAEQSGRFVERGSCEKHGRMSAE